METNQSSTSSSNVTHTRDTNAVDAQFRNMRVNNQAASGERRSYGHDNYRNQQNANGANRNSTGNQSRDFRNHNNHTNSFNKTRKPQSKQFSSSQERIAQGRRYYGNRGNQPEVKTTREIGIQSIEREIVVAKAEPIVNGGTSPKVDGEISLDATATPKSWAGLFNKPPTQPTQSTQLQSTPVRQQQLDNPPTSPASSPASPTVPQLIIDAVSVPQVTPSASKPVMRNTPAIDSNTTSERDNQHAIKLGGK